MLSKLTIAGLHNYGLQINDNLWSNLDLPSGIDEELVVNEILRQASEFGLLYPDYNFMKLQIGVWSKKWKHNFDRWQKAYVKEYEALFNIDVTDVIEEHGINAASENKSHSGNRSTTSGGSQTGSSTDLDTKSKAAFDASTFQNVEQDSASSSTSLSSSESASESDAYSESMSNSSSHDITTTHTKRGNQGITMSQELLLAEFNAWSWNLYQHIAEIFVGEFCITLYS